MEQIPAPARERLLSLLRILEQTSEETLSSARIEALTGWASHTIRKDISFLGEEKAVGSSAGYEPGLLIPVIKKALGLDRRRKFCVVGLGRLGSAYLNLGTVEIGGLTGGLTSGLTGGLGENLTAGLGEFELVAGFDTNVNRTEILPSPVPLYPAYKIGEMVQRFGIEIALLCVPEAAAQAAAEKLVAAGIKGIVNFAPAALNLPTQIAVRNVYVADNLRALAIKINYM